MHRYLSYQRAGVRPTTDRYNIVARHPDTSLLIGISSLIIAGILGIPFIEHMWRSLLWAIPLTFFYLTPPVKGWRRLRDLPYVKVIIVALAWTVITHGLPITVTNNLIHEAHTLDETRSSGFSGSGAYMNHHFYESIVRFLFTLSIAILFDFRDVVLDRSQQVKTIAGDYPFIARLLVAVAMIINIAILAFSNSYPSNYIVFASVIYAATIAVAWWTNERRSEAWFAVVVNGVLWGPAIAGLLLTLTETSP